MLTKGICALVRPIRKAHTEANLANRSASGTFEWHQRQAAGACMQPLCGILKFFHSSALQDSGLVVVGALPGLRERDNHSLEHPAVLFQNGFIQKLFKVVQKLLFFNFHEVVYHEFGCPGIFPSLADPANPEKVDAVLTYLQQHQDIWRTHVQDAEALPGTLWDKLRERFVEGNGGRAGTGLGGRRETGAGWGNERKELAWGCSRGSALVGSPLNFGARGRAIAFPGAVLFLKTISPPSVCSIEFSREVRLHAPILH